MINQEELDQFKKNATEYISDFPGLVFDHFGIKVPGASEYQKMSNILDEIYGEVNFKGRRILSGKLGGKILEILEPMPGETIKKAYIDHISYRTNSIEALQKMINWPIISRFDVGNTHGLKVQPKEGLIIEFRNNSLLDSVQDFK